MWVKAFVSSNTSFCSGAFFKTTEKKKDKFEMENLSFSGDMLVFFKKYLIVFLRSASRFLLIRRVSVRQVSILDEILVS